MKFKEVLITIFLSALVLCLFGLNYISNKFIFDVKNVYKVYLDSEEIGYISDKEDLYSLIDKKQDEIKSRYGVSTVYPPNGLKVINTNTYNVELSSPEEIYDKVSLLSSFTVEGFTINIKDENGKILNSLNILDKDIFDDAIQKYILAFIDEEEYSNYMNNSQPEIEKTGRKIEYMSFDETITLKRDLVPVDQPIYVDSASLSQALLFGEEQNISTYIVKKGDTISSISNANKLNEEEFLIANSKYTSVDSLLKIGDSVNITLINPLLTLTYDVFEVKDSEIAYEKKITYDATKPVTYSDITTAGVTGITRISSRFTVKNGETQGGLEIVSSQEITKKVDQVTTKGGFSTSYKGSYMDTGLDWGWPTNVPYVITSPYGYRWGVLHQGVDISGTGFGSPIYAVQDGTVYFAGWAGSLSGPCGLGGGNCIVIAHDTGYYTMYAHMANNSLTVKTGDRVLRGQIIGGMGSTGESTGTHLHYSIWYGIPWKKGSQLFNPMSFYK